MSDLKSFYSKGISETIPRIFVEQSSTKEHTHPPPEIQKQMQILKSWRLSRREEQACDFSLFSNFTFFKLRSTTEHISALKATSACFASPCGMVESGRYWRQKKHISALVWLQGSSMRTRNLDLHVPTMLLEHLILSQSYPLPS
jgi:hypothetical protein